MDNIRLTVWQPLDLSVNIERGQMVWERTYAFKEEIPVAQFDARPIPPQRIVPRVPTVLGFGFSSGHEKGYQLNADPHTGMVQLADYWVLVVPLWPILLIVSAPIVLWLIKWFRRSRNNRVGFDVVLLDRGASHTT